MSARPPERRKPANKPARTRGSSCRSLYVATLLYSILSPWGCLVPGLLSSWAAPSNLATEQLSNRATRHPAKCEPRTTYNTRRVDGALHLGTRDSAKIGRAHV